MPPQRLTLRFDISESISQQVSRSTRLKIRLLRESAGQPLWKRQADFKSHSRPMNYSRIKAVVIGASAGAIEALSGILPQLPSDYPFPVLIVVHLPPDRDNLVVDLFRRKCSISIVEAEDKAKIQGGTVYFAPPDYHLLVEEDYTLSLSVEPPVNYSRPSIDVLFDSAAELYGERLLGVVLTGASHDGAKGLASLVHAGGAALVQRPETALAATMPQAALDACPSARSAPLNEIAAILCGLSVKT